MSRDGQRVYPVNVLVMHHSVGPRFVNAGEQEVSDWFNNTGRNRGYAGLAHSGHFDPRTGQETFAQAQFALHEFTADGNKYGWRLVELMSEPIHNVAWHAGVWAVNQQSIGIETCGDFRYQDLPDKGCMLVADYFRGIDKELVGAGYSDGLNIIGHKDVFATACPANIYNKLDKIIDMINNPDKWNAILWPEQPKESWKYNKIGTLKFKVHTTGLELVNFETGEVDKSVSFKVGDIIEVNHKTNVYKGHTWYATDFSGSRNIPKGFREKDLYSTFAKSYVEPKPDPIPEPIIPQWLKDLTPHVANRPAGLTPIPLYNIETMEKIGQTGTDLPTTTDYKGVINGREFYITKWSVDNGKPHGFLATDFDSRPATPEPSPEPPKEEEPMPIPTDPENPTQPPTDPIGEVEPIKKKDPFMEGVKLWGRLALSYLISFLLILVIDNVANLPDTITLWDSTFNIKSSVTMILPFLIMGADKVKYEASKLRAEAEQTYILRVTDTGDKALIPAKQSGKGLYPF